MVLPKQEQHLLSSNAARSDDRGGNTLGLGDKAVSTNWIGLLRKLFEAVRGLCEFCTVLGKSLALRLCRLGPPVARIFGGNTKNGLGAG